MDSPAAPVTVVICAHTMERLDDIGAALASVGAQSRPPDQTIVVIDHNPELEEAVPPLVPPGLDVEIVPNSGPKGLSGARNTGTGLASGELVAYLDDDATAETTWLERLTAPFADPAVVAVGGWAVPAWDAGRPDWFPEEFLWVVGCSHRGLPTSLAPVRNVIGCNMAFRRAPVLAQGGFEVGLGRTADRPLGCEETELCIRLTRADAGARVLLEPEARIHHRVPAARTTWRYFVDRCRGEGNSKAHVVGLVGSGDGLSSERSYVTSVLPRALAGALVALPRQPRAAALRAAAIVAGLAMTGLGYVETRWRGRA
jgi:GT2 family glycosyltransferase